MRRLYFDTEIAENGFEEEDYQKLLENISGISFQSFFDNYLNGNHSYEPILQDALGYFGLEMQLNDNPLIAEAQYKLFNTFDRALEEYSEMVLKIKAYRK